MLGDAWYAAEGLPHCILENVVAVFGFINVL